MTFNPVTSSSTPKTTVNKNSIQNQRNNVSIGLKKSLILADIWQPLEFNWYLRWKDYVAFDTVGADNRSDEVSVRPYIFYHLDCPTPFNEIVHRKIFEYC